MDKREYFLRKFLERLPAFQAVFRTVEAEGLASFDLKEPILDLGCGDGIFAEVFLGKGKKIIGVDLDKSALAQAKKKNIYKKLVEADAGFLPFKDGQFNSVLANSSLEHIKALRPVLREVYRVLARGGILILTAPSEKREKYFLGGKVENRFFKHFNCWSGKKWQKKLKNIGFRKVSYLYGGSPMTCLMGDLLLPFGLIGFIERKILGHYFGWRKILAPFSFLILKNFKDKVVDNEGAIIIVKTQK